MSDENLPHLQNDNIGAENNNMLLQVEELQKYFKHDGKTIEVLKEVNLKLNKGDQVSIMGKSGVGKSTLLHILGTLDKPSSGTVLYEGVNVFNLLEKALADFRNRTIGFVFQFHYLLDEFTALENVIMPARIARLNKKEAHDRAKYLLNGVGLSERLTHRPGELSGGEQQRVAIARALIMSPKIVLADEPTGNLDQKTSDEIHDLLMEISLQTKTSFIVATHNLSLASRMPKCLRLENGKIG